MPSQPLCPQRHSLPYFPTNGEVLPKSRCTRVVDHVKYALSQGNKGREPPTESLLGTKMCPRWHSRSVATAKVKSRDCDLQSGLFALHGLRWGGKGLQMSPHLLLHKDRRVPLETTSFPSCLMWIPSQIHLAPFVSKNTEFQPLPHLPSWQPPCTAGVYSLQVWKGRQKKSYNLQPIFQSCSLFLKPRLCLFLQHLTYAVPSMWLNLQNMGDHRTYLILLRIKWVNTRKNIKKSVWNIESTSKIWAIISTQNCQLVQGGSSPKLRMTSSTGMCQQGPHCVWLVSQTAPSGFPSPTVRLQIWPTPRPFLPVISKSH